MGCCALKQRQSWMNFQPPLLYMALIHVVLASWLDPQGSPAIAMLRLLSRRPPLINLGKIWPLISRIRRGAMVAWVKDLRSARDATRRTPPLGYQGSSPGRRRRRGFLYLMRCKTLCEGQLLACTNRSCLMRPNSSHSPCTRTPCILGA